MYISGGTMTDGIVITVLLSFYPSLAIAAVLQLHQSNTLPIHYLGQFMSIFFSRTILFTSPSLWPLTAFSLCVTLHCIATTTVSMHYCSTSGGNEISFATIVIHGIWDTNRSCHPDRWLHGYLYGNIHAKPKNICKVITEQEQLNFTLTNLQITKRVSAVKQKMIAQAWKNYSVK